ncbi:MAG: metal ABC transporter ATP-binding protein [Holosporaceae bacterium]
MRHTYKKTLDAKNIALKRQKRTIVQNLSFSIPKGSLVALVGPNGGGKSTLLESLVSRASQKLFYGFAEEKIAYLPQACHLDRSFPLLVRDVVGTGFWPQLGFWRPFMGRHKKNVLKALRAVGLENFALTPIHALSGGQFQRVLFARLIVQEGSVLLLDEPFTGVDEASIEALFKLIQAWHYEGKTLIVTLHDLKFAQRFFPHALLLARDYSLWGKTNEVLTPDHVAFAYARAHQWEDCRC